MMMIRYYLMKLFCYCFIYSCPKGNVRDTYIQSFKSTRDYIINAVVEVDKG